MNYLAIYLLIGCVCLLVLPRKDLSEMDIAEIQSTIEQDMGTRLSARDMRIAEAVSWSVPVVAWPAFLFLQLIKKVNSK